MYVGSLALSQHTAWATNLNGWHIAMYRSIVNDVIVKTVAFVDVSDSKPCRIQND